MFVSVFCVATLPAKRVGVLQFTDFSNIEQ